ncbi:hypothetical protein K2173_002882 [Erythroxylum novogranatense]|uniref:Uncharacterized protein n=1 Tax=Erythroxylum novogranatense TaxID=1862640 RepID=A0AAV8SQ72_9ROSI|nr:hypothetical protein K2173_002882 [Erythroxylum novogranatense]
MAIYVDEEDVFKCPKHPSRRRRIGICHHCLRHRLASLCPDCAYERPCNCYASSSGSSSSSLSRISASTADGVGAVGRVSSLIESEPAFRRSRSVAVSFLRSKPADSNEYSFRKESFNRTPSSSSFWSLFKSSSGNKSKRVDEMVSESNSTSKKSVDEEERRRMMRKSRSLAVPSDSGVANVKSTKSKGWHFPSPIKVFRQSISRGSVYERSPLHRG